MVSQISSRGISCGLVITLALGVLAALPQSAAHAQDFDAVERHLGIAVAEGMLTLEQASHMMEALHDAAEEEHSEAAKIGAFLKQTGEHLREAVEAGKLTEDQAWAKWQELKKHKLGPWLEGAIEKGSLTQEAARDIWHGIKLAEVGQKLKSAVAKGELTEEEAKAKWAEIECKAHQKD